MLAERTGLQRVMVKDAAAGEEPERAYVLTGLTGPVSVGDRVVVNTTAVDLGLGTGGWHVVHWNLDRHEWVEPGPGHIMKLRYTSLQFDAGSAEEHLDDLPTTLDGMPVVVCGLHSQMAAAAAVLRHRRPDAHITYVMTDGAALPLALSDLVHDMHGSVIDDTITAGNAFGGDLEAVTVPSALTLARHHLGADAVIVAMGPGITGTASTLGTTGLEVATILDQVQAMEGRGVMALRVSEADKRERHRGVSHHSVTVLGLCREPAMVAAAESVDVPVPHQVAVVDPGDVAMVLDAFGLQVTTMGRMPAQDPAFFAAAGAAGALVAGWIASGLGEPDR